MTDAEVAVVRREALALVTAVMGDDPAAAATVTRPDDGAEVAAAIANLMLVGAAVAEFAVALLKTMAQMTGTSAEVLLRMLALDYAA